MTHTGAENIASIATTLHGIFTTVGAGVRRPVAVTDKLSTSPGVILPARAVGWRNCDNRGRKSCFVLASAAPARRCNLPSKLGGGHRQLDHVAFGGLIGVILRLDGRRVKS
jgi:hypothetical protein